MNPRFNSYAEAGLALGGLVSGLAIAAAGERLDDLLTAAALGALTCLLGVACALIAFPRSHKD